MLRLNDDEHPNEYVVFITAVKDEQEQLAKDYLNRIAAMAFPIMKSNGFGVTSLDEVTYNSQFWGRNWNKGECVELVLRDSRGNWLPFEFVMDVFLHELCHIWRGPHDKTFFNHLARLRQDLTELYAKSYKGPGKYMTWDSFPLADVVAGLRTVAHRGVTLAPSAPTGNLCGGSLRRKRNERRATGSRVGKKKNTKAGQKLGFDLDERKNLLHSTSKPQAKSNRGREARLVAAVKRSGPDTQDPAELPPATKQKTLNNFIVID
ncbi:WLM domain metallopeptidase implicated in DNA repair Wss1 [Schizosaccharomyces osmophilus]|uniref:WLM domain metallopeptidase implicated in DNA repair Wss1 n=1 Tax=Schizosaccharomyces osmophilus TaxID=2545709 RepID=A0AAE9WDU7_9SCHI|nr:WLM domain metallopeptidase implicated in DNA repair Wss1 [Schizosaccharomyces osmophilus]WBW72893.1 WLM domain metallopeptidase implicated in DNA repair Wss1 [Schizosaccharomyces osmophilus]